MLLRLTHTAALLAASSRHLLHMLDDGHIHIEAEGSNADIVASKLLNELRRGVAAHAALEADAPVGVLAMPLAGLPDGELDFVAHVAGESAGLSVDQTVQLLPRFGLTEAAEQIRNLSVGTQ
jgi:hypothetical protein